MLTVLFFFGRRLIELLAARMTFGFGAEIAAEEASPHKPNFAALEEPSKISIPHGHGSGDEPLAFVNVELH